MTKIQANVDYNSPQGLYTSTLPMGLPNRGKTIVLVTLMLVFFIGLRIVATSLTNASISPLPSTHNRDLALAQQLQSYRKLNADQNAGPARMQAQIIERFQHHRISKNEAASALALNERLVCKTFLTQVANEQIIVNDADWSNSTSSQRQSLLSLWTKMTVRTQQCAAGNDAETQHDTDVLARLQGQETTNVNHLYEQVSN